MSPSVSIGPRSLSRSQAIAARPWTGQSGSISSARPAVCGRRAGIGTGAALGVRLGRAGEGRLAVGSGSAVCCHTRKNPDGTGLFRCRAGAGGSRRIACSNCLVKLTAGPRRFYDRPVPAPLPAKGMC